MPCLHCFVAITLNPKVTNPDGVNHYKSISLCNILHKIMSKVLENRLKIVLRKSISPLKGMDINNNILVTHDILNSVSNKRNKKGYMQLSWIGKKHTIG